MANEILNSLLKEYEQKKINAEIDLEKRKTIIYNLIPRLKEIDSELTTIGIRTAKNILKNNSDNNSLNNLKQKTKLLKEEKERILTENNYSIDYFKPFYDCKICNDTGFITDKNYKTTLCNCLQQRLLNISFNKSNIFNFKKENFENFNELIFSDEVDLSKYKFNISPRKNINNIKNKCLSFINNFDDPNYKNLLFVGSTGLR